MKYNRIRVDNVDYQQISRPKAERLYEKGESIYLLPCNANPNSAWISLCEIKGGDEELPVKFKAIVNGFEYYNCNKELGKYAVFFIKI